MKFLLIAWVALAASLAAAPLKFEKSLIEVHAPLDSKTVTEDFKFTNSGDSTVVIRETDAGCSCLSVQVSDGKLSYAPGESGTLRAKFEVGSFQGAVDKQINVWLEGDPDEKPSGTVTMRVHIPQIIAITPRTIKWKVGAEPVTKTVDIDMDYEKPIRVTSVSSSNPDFTAKLVAVEEGKKYRIEVTPTGTASPGLSILRVETDLEIKKHRIQQSFAAISPKVDEK